MKIAYLHLADGQRLAGFLPDDAGEALRRMRIVEYEDDQGEVEEGPEPDAIVLEAPCRVSFVDMLLPPQVAGPGAKAGVMTVTNVAREPVAELACWTKNIHAWRVLDLTSDDELVALLKQIHPARFSGIVRNLGGENGRRAGRELPKPT